MLNLMQRVMRRCARIGRNLHHNQAALRRAVLPAVEAIESRWHLSAGPIVLLDGFDEPQTDGQTQDVAWQLVDPSGIQSASVTVQRYAGSWQTLHTSAEPAGSFNFDSYGAGQFSISITATNNDAPTPTTTTFSRTITVLDDDTQGPAISFSGFETGQSDDQTQEVSWNITDPQGLQGATVVVEQIKNGSYYKLYETTDPAGSFNFDSYGAGRFALTINATDGDNDSATDGTRNGIYRTIDVLDNDSAGPSILVSGFEPGQSDEQTQEVSWNITDPQGLQNVTVVVEQIRNGSYYKILNTTDPAGSFNFDSYGAGRFALTINATDGDNDSATDGARNGIYWTIDILDDDAAGPDILVGGIASPQATSDEQKFTWDVTDPSGLSAVSVSVERKINNTSTVLFQGSSPTGEFNFDSYGPGLYAIYVNATDNDLEGAYDKTTRGFSRTVEVKDLGTGGPAITLGGSSGIEDDAQNQLFTWASADSDGLQSTSLTIQQSTGSSFSTIYSSTAASGSYDFNPKGTGIFLLSITSTDLAGNISSATRQVTVTDDDTTLPIITLGGSIGEELDSAPQSFSWASTDASGIASTTVTVTRSLGTSSTVVYSSTSASASSGSVAFDSYGPGIYYLKVEVTDADKDSTGDGAKATAIRRLVVSEDDAAGPAILLSGSQGTELDSQSQSFAWASTDPSGLSKTVVTITRTVGTSIFTIHSSTSTTVHAGSFNFDSYGPGLYQITVAATDADGDGGTDTATAYASQTVLVVDDDPLPPSIDITGLSGLQDDGQTQAFSWNVTDPSGTGPTSVTITRNAGGATSTIFTSTALSGSFNFDHLGLGTYVITVTSADTDADYATDSSTLTASRSVTVLDDDTSPAQILLFGSEGSESHALTNAFAWEVLGGGAASITLRQAGAVVYSDSALSGSFNFDHLGLGTFDLSVSASDDDNDWPGDATPGTVLATRQVIVTNAAPAITLLQAAQPASEGDSIAFSAVASDSDNDSLSYLWDFGDGSTAAGPSPAHVYADNGTYTLTLTIDDGYGGTASQSIPVSILNAAPTPALSDAPTGAVEGSPITLTGSATDPGPADIASLSLAWTIAKDGAAYTAGTGPAISFLADDNGTYAVTLIATDKDGGTASATQTFIVSNLDPTAQILNAPTTSLEGETITLAASATDPSPADAAAGFSFAWSVTQDGAAYASGSGPAFTFTPLAPGAYALTLTATDKDGGQGTATSTITVEAAPVTNPPEVTLTAPAQAVPFQALAFNATLEAPAGTDAYALQSADPYTLQWDFGDGTILPAQPASDPAALNPTHAYAAAGQYTLRLTLAGNGFALVQTATINVSAITTSGSTIYLGGSNLANAFSITREGIRIDGATVGTLGSANTLVIFGGPGSDSIDVASSITTNVILIGGPGNDSLKGGAGNDIILGGDGDDMLSGSHGRDLIIGGRGADRLIGNTDDDLLVAGTTAFDDAPDALRALQAEWTSARDYDTRVANLRGLGAGPRDNGSIFLRSEIAQATVFDDATQDLLTGNAGLDWFIFNADQGITDRVTDLHSGEFTTDEIAFLSEGTGIVA